MKVSLKSIELLQKKLKNIDSETSSNDLESIANAVNSISKCETTDDILELSDLKHSEILDSAKEKLSKIESISELSGSIIDQSKLEISSKTNDNLSEITEDLKNNENSLSSMGEEIKNLLLNFNDTTIQKKIQEEFTKNDFLNSKNLPFLFGILSRNDDNYGVGNLTSELGKWSTTAADSMLQLLAGCHNYTTEYSGFCVEPKLCFFQGSKGNFSKKKSYIKHTISTNMYQYPYAALGCLFIKNTTEKSITSTLNFGGSSAWSSGYEGAGVFVGTPNSVEKSLNWTNIYSYTSSAANFSGSANIWVPGNTTVAVLFYTSSFFITSAKGYHSQFLAWQMNKLSEFLINGLEIDIEKTLKAWQCPGFSTTYELFL